MKMKKLISMLMAATLIVGITACGAQEESKQASSSTAESSETASAEQSEEEPVEVPEEPKDPVELVWYYRGTGIQKDTQAVNDRVNELLKEYEGLEHVTVKLNPVLYSEWVNTVLLAQTAGEQIDILNSYGLDYVGEIRNGTYLAIDEYLESEEYAELYDTLPEWLWETLAVDGNIYLVPNYQRGANRGAFTVNDENAALFDLDAFAELATSGASTPEEVEEIGALIEELVVNVREKEESDKVYAPAIPGWYEYSGVQNGAFLGELGDNVASGGFIMLAGDNKVQNAYYTENYKKACEVQAGLYEKGLISEDILVTKPDTYFEQGNGYMPLSGTNSGNTGTGYVDFTWKEVPGKLVMTQEHFFMVNGWAAAGNGITSSCEHPEEALLFLTAINSGTEKGKEIYNTIVYGLEGVHYEKISENRIKTLEYDGAQGGADVNYSAHKWCIGNTFNAWMNQSTTDDNAYEKDLAVNEDPENVISPVMGFRLDTAPIETEISQCQAIVTEYKDTLNWGVKGKDWEAYYNEFIAKMDAAGCQKVIDEIQAQYDAWLKIK